MKVIDKVAIASMGVILITNPASSQFILDGLDYIFQQIFIHASPINFVASGVMIVYIGYKMYATRERVNVPKKSAKTLKAGKLIET